MPWRSYEASGAASGSPGLAQISAAELWAGARPAEHDALNRLFDALTCVGVDAATGRQAGDYLRHYGKSHAKLGDALIAAAAVLNHAALWTRNRKHYPMKEVAFF